MRISPEYLDRFAVAPSGPTEIPLGGWEIDPMSSTSVDDPEGHSLAVCHWDEWPVTAQWDIKEGTEKRWTYVRLTNENGVVGDVGYEFPGLVKLADLRAWYRAKLGLPDDSAAEKHPPMPQREIPEDHQ